MFFFLLISYNIFSLCQNTHTLSHFCFSFLSAAVKQKAEIQNHVMLVLVNVGNPRSDDLVGVWNSQNGSGECCKASCCAVTTGTWSSRTPAPSPSPPSTRCRLCSGKPPSSVWSWWRRSKRQVTPGRIGNNPCGESCWWTCMFSWAGGASAALATFLLDTWFLHVGEVKNADSFSPDTLLIFYPFPPLLFIIFQSYRCHRSARWTLADSDRMALPFLTLDTLHAHSVAPCRLEAPAVGCSTDPESLRYTGKCKTDPWEHTGHEHICRKSRKNKGKVC